MARKKTVKKPSLYPVKEICGQRHVHITCVRCLQKIWTAEGKGLLPEHYVCNSCYPLAGVEISQSSYNGDRIYPIGTNHD